MKWNNVKINNNEIMKINKNNENNENENNEMK